MDVRDGAAEYRIEPVSAADADDVPPGYKRTEVGVIPADWTTCQLGALFQFSGGVSASRDQLGVDGYCYLHYGDIHTARSTCVDVRRDFASIPKLDVRLARVPRGALLADGDIVFVDASEDEDGTSKHVVVINPDATPFIAGLHTIVAKPRTDMVAPAFRRFCFQSSAVKAQFRFYAVGTKVLGVSKSNIDKIWLPLPPTRGEQKAIAEALSDADELIESLQQLIAKQRAIKQGAMQALLTGRQRLPGFSGEWHEVQFGDVAGIRRDRVNPAVTPSLQFCVELEHIEAGTGRLIGHTVTGPGSSLKSVFQEGDVLFGKLRAYLRKYWHADRDGVCSTEIWCLFPKGVLVSSELLFQIVQNDSFIEAASVAYGTHMPRSDWKSVQAYALRIPIDPKEQIAITAVLSDMDAAIDALEARLAKTRALKAGMMQLLLTGRIRLL